MGRSINQDIIFDQQVQGFTDKLKALVKELGIKAENSEILTSPLKRCLSSSAIIQAVTGSNQPVRSLEDLTETDMGLFEGHNPQQLRALYPGELNRWMFDPEHFQFPQGESYQQLSLRVDRVVGLLLETARPEFLFICTHVDWIKMLILKIRSQGFNARRSINVPNGNISLLNLSPEKKLGIVSLNWQPTTK